MDELADRPVLAIDLGGTQIRVALIIRGGSHRPRLAATIEQGALRP